MSIYICCDKTNSSIGSATTIISNPIWVIQTSQTVRTITPSRSLAGQADKIDRSQRRHEVAEKLGFFETARRIIRKDGITAFWRGIGPALVLVMNPVLQYTVFERLKTILITRRRVSLNLPREANVVLSDLDFFFLGALSKLGRILLFIYHL